MIYLDSAAVVKLAHAEPETPALRSWLNERTETGWISSVLTEIESFRALGRYAPDAVARLPAVLDQIDLIDLGPSIRILAQTAKPVTVRSLDAIHLDTALHSRSGLTSFVTYDKRLLEAAKAAGLPVDTACAATARDGGSQVSSVVHAIAVIDANSRPALTIGGQCPTLSGYFTMCGSDSAPAGTMAAQVGRVADLLSHGPVFRLQPAGLRDKERIQDHNKSHPERVRVPCPVSCLS